MSSIMGSLLSQGTIMYLSAQSEVNHYMGNGGQGMQMIGGNRKQDDVDKRLLIYLYNRVTKGTFMDKKDN
jgi:hypothetical protein